MPTTSLDQQRAAYAWQCVQGCSGDYTNLAKAAPALIMNNGLMQALAFYQSKSKPHHLALNKHLREWLKTRFPKQFAGGNYAEVMQGLFGCEDPHFYPQATDETLALLRWIRQFAAANS
ncbi:MAG: type III-B CRISPR module-associated protein Cmr5 [Candidatus Competibacteraceae bacterium]|jgi:CRISPR-associated protein Cmr5|nr:MAG: type III-B CRISPR module-associated protein Cmr5 [Candidatus Competibacteraceae bacterium]